MAKGSRSEINRLTKSLYCGEATEFIHWAVALIFPFIVIVGEVDWLNFSTLPAVALNLVVAAAARNGIYILAGLLSRTPPEPLAEYNGDSLELCLETRTRLCLKDVHRISVPYGYFLFLPWGIITISRHDGSRLKIQTAITHLRLLLLLRRVSRDVRRLNAANHHPKQDF